MINLVHEVVKGIGIGLQSRKDRVRELLFRFVEKSAKGAGAGSLSRVIEFSGLKGHVLEI